MSDSNNQAKVSASKLTEKQRLVQEMLRRRQGVATQTTAMSVVPRGANEPTLLSYAQQRLWFLDQLTPNTSAYVFTNLVRLSGNLNASVLKRSIAEIVQRHENLRTGFKDDDGVLLQVIENEPNVDVAVLDLTHLPHDEREHALRDAALSDSRTNFDLSQSPLFRATLVRCAEFEHTLILSMHHIIYDGWSLAVLFGELKSLYEAFDNNQEPPLSSLAVQYADYALWQRKRLNTEQWQNQLDYWQNQLSAPLPSLDLPTDRLRPAVLNYEGRVEWFYLPTSLSAGLRALAKREDCTLFMVLITVFNLLLQRYSGDAEVLVGTAIAGRNHRELEVLIGFFVNTLVIRTPIDGDMAFSDLLQQVKQTTTEAYSNQDVPFESLVERLLPDRRANQNPIFQTMFALQNTPPPPDAIGDVNMQIEEFDNGTSVFDLTLSMYETDKQLSGYFEYSTELFDQSTITRMVSAYETLLGECVSNPEKRVADLSVLGNDDRRLIFQEWNDTESERTENSSVVIMFDRCAEQQSEAIAIICEEREVSYAELARTSNSIAATLVASGVKANDFVGICLGRSVEMFAAILGVLKAGAAYLPLDPTYPTARLQFMVSDSETRHILSSRKIGIDLTVNSEVARNIFIEDLELDDESELPPLDVSRKSDDLAYAIYTSGSTGTPKAVLITHANLFHSTQARLEFYGDPVRAFLLMSSFSFDSSIAGIFWTLCTGGALILPADQQERDIFAIGDLIEKNAISHMLCLPSVYSLLLDNSVAGDMPSLSVVCVAGEECPPSLVKQHFDTIPDALLYNEYGPTEGTVWSTAYQCQVGDWAQTVPIGKPINNVEIYILDDNGKSAPIGVPGEICIAGDGLAPGYINRQDLSDEKFVNLKLEDGIRRRLYRSGDVGRYKSDGNVEFLGRMDDQVKVNGYRIEIPEIESILMSQACVSGAIVIARRSESSDNRLVAYVIASEDQCEQIEEALRSQLPAFMVPSIIVAMSVFPLTPNGKVDKNALPDPLVRRTTEGKAAVAPQSDLEKVLAGIWLAILERDQVSIDDNFFEIGGNSILATRVISKIYHSFGKKVPVRSIFEHPTIRSFADDFMSNSKTPDQILETAALIVQIDAMSDEELDRMLSEESNSISPT